MSAPPTWRDRLAVHSAAEKFDELEGAELDALVNDIRQYGLKQPIALLQPDPKVPTYKVLDGRNRLNAAERAGIRLFKEDGTLDWGGGRNFKVVGGDSAFDPVAFVVSANVHRRHLSADDKRKIIADLLRANPERSDRATASIAKVDHKTVAAVRETAEERGEIPHVESRTDTKGRTQPGSKPQTKEAWRREMRERSALPPIVPENQRLAVSDADVPSMSQPDAQLVTDAKRRIGLAVPPLLARDPVGGLAHIAQAIERAKVPKSLSHAARVEAAQAFLMALGVRPEDFGGQQ